MFKKSIISVSLLSIFLCISHAGLKQLEVNSKDHYKLTFVEYINFNPSFRSKFNADRHIIYTTEKLISSCTTKVEIKSLPTVQYIGIKVKIKKINYELHIFKNSLESLQINIYLKENKKIFLLGKYSQHSYQLISMLELLKSKT